MAQTSPQIRLETVKPPHLSVSMTTQLNASIPLAEQHWQLSDVARYAACLILSKHLGHVGVIRILA
jgi:hypothetical protein